MISSTFSDWVWASFDLFEFTQVEYIIYFGVINFLNALGTKISQVSMIKSLENYR